MALVKCPECGKQISTQARDCVHCGAPISDEIQRAGSLQDNASPRVIAEYSYSMMDANPLFFFASIALSLIGVGIVFLLAWRLIMLPNPKLTITDRALIYRDSLFKTHRIAFYDIKTIVAGGSFSQNLIRSGWLKISREGFFNFPLVINGLSRPKKIKELISKHMI